MWPEDKFWLSVCIGITIGFLFVLLSLWPHRLFAAEAWTQPKEEATAKEEKMIYEGCAFKAEMVFYAAQEKVYNGGNEKKMLAYLEEHMTRAEWAVQKQFMQWIGRWVDTHDYGKPSDYAKHLFMECVSNSYTQFNKIPSSRAQTYINNFLFNLRNVEEQLLPNDAKMEYSA